MQKKISLLTRIWISFCIVANLAVIVLGAVAFGSGIYEPLNSLTESQQMLVILPYVVILAGYIVLMCGKKSGYFIVFVAAIINAIYSLSISLWLPALFCLLNPVITWLLVRSRWAHWKEIDEQNREIRKQLAAKYKEDLEYYQQKSTSDKSNTKDNLHTKQLKSRKVALFLTIFPYTGVLGIDLIYLGYVKLGLLKLITAGGCLVWYVIDIVKIAKGTMRDVYGRPLK